MNATKKELTDEEKAASAPFTLPSGSFDLMELDALTRAAEKAKPEKRDELIAAGLTELNQKAHSDVDVGLEPGFHRVEVARDDVAEGLVETIQVRDEKAIAEAEKAAAKAEQKGEPVVVPPSQSGVVAEDPKAAAAAKAEEGGVVAQPVVKG